MCRYYLQAVVEDNKLIRVCKSCGHQEEDKGGLIQETYIKEQSSESYKILLNPYTRQDPTLPYLTDLKCPNTECASNKGTAKRIIKYFKYDSENLKFVYICDNCEQTWTTR
jgi:DNA-directed RNA polymerase subunit M/transcription elongation factor TFIIS